MTAELDTGYDLVVVGAGPTGLVSALLAAQSGQRVVVLEKKSMHSIRGYAHYLNAYTLEILASVGVDMQVLLAGSASTEQALSMVYCTSLQRPFAHIKLTDDPDFMQAWHSAGRYHGCAHVSFMRVWQALYDCCQHQAITIFWDTEVHDCTQHNTSVCVQARQQNPQREFSCTASYLACCDGVRATMAHALHIPWAHKTSWQSFLSVDIEADLSPFCSIPAMLYWIYHPDLQACMVAHDLSSHQVLQIPLASGESSDDYSQAVLVEKMSAACNRDLPTSAIDIKHIGVWHMHTQVLSRLQLERVFFLGDAAHAMTPAGGMGLNAGIADAYNLIWKLAQGNVRRLVPSYQSERLPVVSKQVSQSIENFQDFLALPKLLGMRLDNKSSVLQGYSSCLQLVPMPAWRHAIDITVSAIPSWIMGSDNLLFKGMQASVHNAVAGNARHFKGLDQHLGFVYQSECVWQFKTGLGSYTLDYDLLLPGRLLPNIEIKPQDGSGVCHLAELLGYTHWTLIVSDDCQDVEARIGSFNCVKVLRQGTSYQPVLKAFRLGRGSFLLVRPDRVLAVYEKGLSKALQSRLMSWFKDADGFHHGDGPHCDDGDERVGSQ